MTTGPLELLGIERRAIGPNEVLLDVLYCGICHSDIHTVRDEWRVTLPSVYPSIPGHEIIGRVQAVGSAVTKFKVGAASNIKADIELICPDQINQAYDGVVNKDVRYRFVIDMASLKVAA
jgi:D-arabinose 1-dehydrogenase-like Zn-dependent alcohol dehydrogenase